MNYRSALIIENSPGEHALVIEEGIRSIGFEFSSVQADDAVEYLKKHTREGTEPAVVVIDPSINNGLPLARRIRGIWPHGEVLFAPDSEDVERLSRELRYAPMIGSNWSLSAPDNPRLPELIEKAAMTSRQRVRLRTTLNRANSSIQGDSPRIEHTDYQRLAASEHYLASVLEQSEHAILSLDMSNRILFWSAGAERLFKRAALEIAARDVSEMPFWSNELNDCIAEIRSGRRSLTREIRADLPTGTLDLEILFSGVYNHAGRVIGTSLSLRDVSARKHLLEAERDARYKAEEASRMKDEFLAILSHELRTPLSTVIGRTQLLQLKYPDNADLQASLDVIERNAQQQARLIEDLLDISAVAAGKLRLNMQQVNLSELLQDVIASIKPAAGKKQIEIVEDRDDGVVTVEGDPLRLRQIFLNVLTNAIKFTPAKGRVAICSRWNSSRVETVIEDNGIGIPQSFLPMIFDRFGQVDSSSSRSYGGMGLGLSIAKQLVDLHSGSIEVTSAGEGQGACFRIILPVVPTATEVPSLDTVSHGTTQADRLAGRRVLLVEDVTDAREMITEILRSNGAIVQDAESGEQALQLLDDFKPHVLVSDIGMPQMDGYRLLQEIRQRGYSNEMLPALALTAFASHADRAKARLAGFQKHIPKPLIVSDLINAIADLVGSNQRI